MTTYIEGDIFLSPAKVIVNTVNTVGVMGKGLALSFKNKYPEMFEAYKKACEKNQLTIGKLMLYNAPDYSILLFPTKEHWRYPSKLEYIEKGLNKFCNSYMDKNITSIAFPKLGCGNGELDWNDVLPIMEKYLKPLPIDVYIYTGNSRETIPEHKDQKSTMDWLRSNARDMSFNGIKDDIAFQSNLLAYEFIAMNNNWSAKWKEGLCLSNKDHNDVFIEEDAFFAVWDEIRNAAVFAAYDDTNKILICSLLESLGYIAKIKLKDQKTSKFVDGYQCNEGGGRLFAYRGIAV